MRNELIIFTPGLVAGATITAYLFFTTVTRPRKRGGLGWKPYLFLALPVAFWTVLTWVLFFQPDFLGVLNEKLGQRLKDISCKLQHEPLAEALRIALFYGGLIGVCIISIEPMLRTLNEHEKLMDMAKFIISMFRRLDFMTVAAALKNFEREVATARLKESLNN